MAMITSRASAGWRRSATLLVPIGRRRSRDRAIAEAALKKAPVFDGHNDILYRLLMNPAAREAIWLTGEGKGHLDLPRMKAGGFAGGDLLEFVGLEFIE